MRSYLYQEIKEDEPFLDLEIENFELVSNWLHFAILELTQVRGFKSSSKWISERLGITKAEADDAIDRLLILGLLARNGDKLVLVKSSAVRDVPSAAIRQFHKSHLEKAIVALEEQAFEQRNFSGITMAINPKQLPLAAEMIKKFRRKLMKVLEEGDKTLVYHLSLQLYQLDKEDR